MRRRRWLILGVVTLLVIGAGVAITRTSRFQKWYNPPVLILPQDGEVVEVRASLSDGRRRRLASERRTAADGGGRQDFPESLLLQPRRLLRWVVRRPECGRRCGVESQRQAAIEQVPQTIANR